GVQHGGMSNHAALSYNASSDSGFGINRNPGPDYRIDDMCAFIDFAVSANDGVFNSHSTSKRHIRVDDGFFVNETIGIGGMIHGIPAGASRTKASGKNVVVDFEVLCGSANVDPVSVKDVGQHGLLVFQQRGEQTAFEGIWLAFGHIAKNRRLQNVNSGIDR